MSAVTCLAPPCLFASPFWLPGAHAQTIYAATVARLHPDRSQSLALRQLAYRRERWDTPDGDFVDVDFLDAAATTDTATDARTDSAAPLLVLFHGLEGSSRSHYALSFAHWAWQQGWAYAVPHFRGCSGELNRGPRAYHSGDFAEVDWILRRMQQTHGRAGAAGPARPLLAVGVSLGGNALLRWAQERGRSAAEVVRACVAISAPLDLNASGAALGRGPNRWLYTPMFLRSMKPKALRKWAQYPGLFERERLVAARTLYEFDDVFTAVLHGFRDVHDYWTRASAKPGLAQIRVPTLVLNARNDPFVPAASLPLAHEVSADVTLWQPRQGGHVGFASGAFPGHVHGLPQAVGQWLQERGLLHRRLYG